MNDMPGFAQTQAVVTGPDMRGLIRVASTAVITGSDMRGLYVGLAYNAASNENFTLSNTNRTCTAPGSNPGSLLGVAARSTGRRYVEFVPVMNGANNSTFGISRKLQPDNVVEQVGDSSDSWGLFVNSGETYVYHSGGTAQGNFPTAWSSKVVGCAVNFDTGKIWFSLDNVWRASGSPSAGTGAAYSDISGVCRVACTIQTPGGFATTNFTGATQTYTPPSGFTPWDD